MVTVKGLDNYTPFTVTVTWGSTNDFQTFTSNGYADFDVSISLPTSGETFTVEIAGESGLVNGLIYLRADGSDNCYCKYAGGEWESLPTSNGASGHLLVLRVKMLVQPDNSTREGIVIGDWEAGPGGK
jgi:hypothetical protein